jgi:hypothetical protein
MPTAQLNVTHAGSQNREAAIDPTQSVVNVGFTASGTTAPDGIPSRERPRSKHISKLSGWYKSLYRSHRGPLCKKDGVQKTFHQGSLLPRFPD